MKRDPIVGTYTEAELRKAAWIIGPSGGAAKALADAERRRAEGEVVAFYRTQGGYILVGPDVKAMKVSNGVAELRSKVD